MSKRDIAMDAEDRLRNSCNNPALLAREKELIEQQRPLLEREKELSEIALNRNRASLAAGFNFQNHPAFALRAAQQELEQAKSELKPGAHNETQVRERIETLEKRVAHADRCVKECEAELRDVQAKLKPIRKQLNQIAKQKLLVD